MKTVIDDDSRLRAIVESLAEGIIGYDGAGRIETVNSEAARIFGLDPATLLGTDVGELIPALGSSQPGVRGSGIRATGLRPDGIEVPLELSVGVELSDTHEVVEKIGRVDHE